MTAFIEFLLDLCKRNTPAEIVIHGPTWTKRMKWDRKSRALHDMLINHGWHVEERLGAVHLRTPWLPQEGNA